MSAGPFQLWSNIDSQDRMPIESMLASRMIELILDANYHVVVRSVDCKVVEGYHQKYLVVWIGSVVFLRTHTYRIIIDNSVESLYINLYHDSGPTRDNLPISSTEIDLSHPDSVETLNKALSEMVQKSLNGTWSDLNHA